MLLERTSARPVGSMPAGSPVGGRPVGGPPMFEEGEYGPTRGYLSARVPLTYAVMVAALVDADVIGWDDVATPELVRYEVEYQVAARGMTAVYQTWQRLADANVRGDEWVMLCRRAVLDMLIAEGVPSGVDELTAGEMAAALMVHSDLYAEHLSTPVDVRRELTRLAYSYGVDALRRTAASLAGEPYRVLAPASDAEAHAWPAFCRRAVAGMLAADIRALAGVR
ncbi:hypothetical protein Francci3_1196 [Frankia casuarinae]|uniref:Uncharacterized protein n=2 Tax=Frankia casuarinae (strain DSM 45818 / CECT 9043 / HFP020203 / CcI3) TaxID=106370 RepID=Q2JDR8_FRACC|nr:hypothetical protein Francci3_1196 [Frankia casuarinae]